jgi:hypothetical protein
VEKPGAGEANRTPDPNLGNVTALLKIEANRGLLLRAGRELLPNDA